MASSLAQCQAFGSSYDFVMEGWEPKENSDGVVYFINNQRKVTSWIHPYLNKVFEQLGDYNDVKYAAYRTALKLRFLQVKCGLNWISIKSVKKVFPTKSGINDSSSNEDTLSCREIFEAVYQVIELSDSFRICKDKLVQVSEIILNLILELFDTSRCGKVAKRSVRVVLAVLCSAKLSDKYRFFFDEISNDLGHIRREKFLYLIYDLMQITELLKESTAFGTNVSAAVNSCLKVSSSNDNNSVHDQGSQDDFFTWLLQEPICIVWLPTLHRVIATETIRHNVQCGVCNIQPMVGFRYRCMQCFRYDLCQSCFFQGLFSQGHRLKHPMQEYCFPTTRRDNTKALLKIVRNKVSKRHRQTKIKLLPVDDDSITGSVFQWQPRNLIPNPSGSFYSSTDSGLAGSSDTDVDCPVSGRLGDQAYDEDNLAMMKRWCKPVEVLGEPCNTSSPCVQESMSKKNMDSQQFVMAQTIQQLQEENRVLRQKLSAVRKRELEEEENSREKSMKHIPVVVVHERHMNGDPLKEITTDEPISPINPLAKSDVRTTKTPGSSFLTDRDFEMVNVDNCPEVSVNVLELVGSCTPIQSTFCMDNDYGDCTKKGSGSAAGSNEESGINEDGGLDSYAAYSDKSCSSDDGYKPPRNPVVISLKTEATDTETESSTSNDLEYTYSDMSIKSDATSCRSSQSSKTHGAVTFEPPPQLKIEEKQGSVHDLNSNEGQNISSTAFDDNTTPQGCNGIGDYTSDFLTPNTTKNETSVELDAFKLCRLKFNSPDDIGSDEKGENDYLRESDSQPHLIYSSKGLQQNEGQFHDSSSFRASRIVIDGGHEENKNTPLHFQQFFSSKNSFYPSFDLSCIPTQESSSFSFVSKPVSSFPSQPPVDSAGLNRRKTLEPVYMSTPVIDTTKFRSSSKSAYRKKSALAKKVLIKQHREKENQSPLPSSCRDSGRSRSSSSISSVVESDSPQDHFYNKEASSFGATPKSSIPPGQRQRILLSMNQFESNRSYSCDNLTFDRDVGMTTLFDRAEHHRTVGAGSQSLPLEDKEELERLIDQVKIGESQCSDLPPCNDIGNSSILQAVFSVGDAMADFVQATADVQLRQRESTYL